MVWGFVLGTCFCGVFLGVLHLAEEEKSGYFTVCSSCFVSLPHGPVGWSVIVAFCCHNHLLFDLIPDKCSYKSLSKFIHSFFKCKAKLQL